MKTGRLTKEESLYIETNCEDQTPSEIAEYLDRRVEAVVEYITKIPGKKINKAVDGIKSKPFWNSLLKQFDQDEIEQFSEEYSSFISQFEGEVLHSEEIQIVDSIRIGILANRCLIEEKKTIDLILKIEKDLFKEKTKKTPDPQVIQELEHNCSLYKQIQHHSSERYSEFIKTKLTSLDKLKATRASRESARSAGYNTSFKDWMRRLVDDKDFRQEVGNYAEKMRMAVDKEYLRLSKPHMYMDNKIDIPVLNIETSKFLEEEN